MYEREERYFSEKAERTLEESENRGIGLNWEWRWSERNAWRENAEEVSAMVEEKRLRRRWWRGFSFDFVLGNTGRGEIMWFFSLFSSPKRRGKIKAFEWRVQSWYIHMQQFTHIDTTLPYF